MSEITHHRAAPAAELNAARSALAPLFESKQLLAESRHSPQESVRQVQELVNKAYAKIGSDKRIEVDGQFGRETKEAIQSFQRSFSVSLDAGPNDSLKLVRIDASSREKGLFPDGVVGPRTAAVLSLIVGEGMEQQLPRFSEFKSGVTGGIWDVSQVRSRAAWVASDAPIPSTVRRALANLSEEEIGVYTAIAKKHHVDPQWLFAVGMLESGMQPNIGNLSGSSAVGVLQFTQKTIDGFNKNRKLIAQTGPLTREKILGMSLIEQAPLVDSYLSGVLSGKAVNNVTDLYLSVLYPRAMGRENDHVLFSASTNRIAYRQNRSAFETNSDGKITVGEVSQAINKTLSSLTVPAKNGRTNGE